MEKDEVNISIQYKVRTISNLFRFFFQQLSPIISNFQCFQELQYLCGKIWKEMNKNLWQYLKPAQSYGHFWPVPAIIGNFWQFLSIFGMFFVLTSEKKFLKNWSQYLNQVQSDGSRYVSYRRCAQVAILNQVTSKSLSASFHVIYWTCPTIFTKSVKGLLVSAGEKNRWFLAFISNFWQLSAISEASCLCGKFWKQMKNIGPNGRNA